MDVDIRPGAKGKTQLALIHAAGSLFARNGFDATSIRDICAAAKVNNAAVNYHFGSKAGLYKAVVAYGIHTGKKLFPNPVQEKSERPELFLCRHIETILQRMRIASDNKWYAKILHREMLFPVEEIERLIEEEYIIPDTKLFSRTFRLIEPEAKDSIINSCIMYLMGIIFFQGMPWPHFRDIVLSRTAPLTAVDIKDDARSIAEFVVAGLKRSVRVHAFSTV